MALVGRIRQKRNKAAKSKIEKNCAFINEDVETRYYVTFGDPRGTRLHMCTLSATFCISTIHICIQWFIPYSKVPFFSLPLLPFSFTHAIFIAGALPHRPSTFTSTVSRTVERSKNRSAATLLCMWSPRLLGFIQSFDGLGPISRKDASYL